MEFRQEGATLRRSRTLEDNVYRAQGLLASSNAELVQDAADLVQALGRRVASIAESRSLLGLD